MHLNAGYGTGSWLSLEGKHALVKFNLWDSLWLVLVKNCNRYVSRKICSWNIAHLVQTMYFMRIIQVKCVKSARVLRTTF